MKLLPCLLFPLLLGGGRDGRPTIEEMLRLAKERAERENREAEARVKDLLVSLDLPYEKNSTLLSEKIDELVRMGPRVVPFLLPALNNAANDDRAVQRGRNCARAIAQIGGPEAVPTLLKLLESGTREGRWNAIFVLGSLREASAERGLLAFVDSQRDSDHRSLAIWALGQLKLESSVGPLTAYLRGADLQTARTILEALDSIHSPKAVAPVAELLCEPYFHPMLKRLLDFLYGMGSKEALPSALKALSLPDLNKSQTVWLIQAVGQLGSPSHPPGVSALKPFLGSQDKEIRDEAAFALNDLGEEAGVKGLLAPLDDYLRDYPRDPKGFEARGRVLLRLRRYRDALRDFQSGVRVSRKDAPVADLYIYQARCYSAMNQLKEAYNALKTSELDPTLLARYKDYPEFKALREHEKYGQIFGK